MPLESAKRIGRLRILDVLKDIEEERTQRRFDEFAKKSEEEGECTDEVLGEENKSKEFVPPSMEEVRRLSREKIVNFGQDWKEYKRREAEEKRIQKA